MKNCLYFVLYPGIGIYYYEMFIVTVTVDFLFILGNNISKCRL